MGDDRPPESGGPYVPATRSRYPDQEGITPMMAGLPALGLVGRSLGEYRIEAKIGQGGMGHVYRASHVRLGKLVALKVLPADRFDDLRAVSRFLREMRAVGRLEHPNIVLARDAGEVDGVHFLVMELLEGVDLAALVKRSGPLGVALACELIRQAALGLQHAHEQGLVHRDIKPSNLMLTPAGVVKVLDLGLALIREATPGDAPTSDGAIMGTTDYMAPEQWTDSHRVDIRADLYSLGCTLYVLLLGEPPFGGATHPTTRAKMIGHLHEAPAPIRGRRVEVPVELAAILDRLLAKSPEDRFATPRELADALAPMASAEGIRRLLGLDPIGPGPGLAPDPPPAGRREPVPVDDVQFTVYRPRVLVPIHWHPLLVFAHLAESPPDAPVGTPDPIEEVRRQAEAVLGPRRAAEYQQSTQDSTRDVPREGVLTIVPDAAGIEFNPPRRCFRWEESVHREEFRLRAPADLDGRTIKGRVSAYLGSILIAEVALRFRVDSGHEPAADAPMERDQARVFRRIFASFAPADRPVADQFERFARAMGDQYLSSCTALRAGDAWDDRLRELIDKADVFQLFWSRNALRSPMVEREWRHALSLGRPSFLRPVYWEDPLPADPGRGLPPEGLRRLYFQRLDGIELTAPDASDESEATPMAGPGDSDVTEARPSASAINLARPSDSGINLPGVGGKGPGSALPEKDIFEDTDFDLEVDATDEDDDQIERSSDFDLEESDPDSEVDAPDEDDVDQNAATAMGAAAADEDSGEFSAEDDSDDAWDVASDDGLSASAASPTGYGHSPAGPRADPTRQWIVALAVFLAVMVPMALLVGWLWWSSR